MSQRLRLLILLYLALGSLSLSVWVVAQRENETAQAIARPAKIHPDYCNAVLPPNIAPANFQIDEKGVEYAVTIHSTHDSPIEIHSKEPGIIISPQRWKKLLAANRGEKLKFDILVKDENGNWTQFETIENTIANEEIDPYLVYRKINLCIQWRYMGIFQRNLETYDESAVLHNRSFSTACFNCHTFMNNDPGHMVLQVRSGEFGTPMLLVDGDSV
ncbi:hypothetical protein JXA32_14745, partial [Candidatus Sumerlaeota bacterium]|nr:hypothetical protein [Candidatus Sumerlaeota bacterium]